MLVEQTESRRGNGLCHLLHSHGHSIRRQYWCCEVVDRNRATVQIADKEGEERIVTPDPVKYGLTVFAIVRVAAEDEPKGRWAFKHCLETPAVRLASAQLSVDFNRVNVSSVRSQRADCEVCNITVHFIGGSR